MQAVTIRLHGYKDIKTIKKEKREKIIDILLKINM
jgi:hypothetical protein